MGEDWEHFESEVRSRRRAPASTRRAWALSLTGSELQAIEEAGTLADRQSITYAEAARKRGGYGGLGPDVKVPDQRHLLTDCDPLD